MWQSMGISEPIKSKIYTCLNLVTRITSTLVTLLPFYLDNFRVKINTWKEAMSNKIKRNNDAKGFITFGPQFSILSVHESWAVLARKGLIDLTLEFLVEVNLFLCPTNREQLFNTASHTDKMCEPLEVWGCFYQQIADEHICELKICGTWQHQILEYSTRLD